MAPGTTLVNLAKDATLLTARRRYQPGAGPLTADTRARLAQDFDLGAWTLYGALYGPRALIEEDAASTRRTLVRSRARRLEFDDGAGGTAAFALRARLARGVADMSAHAALDWVGTGAHLDFDTALAQTGDAVRSAVDASRALSDEHGLDYLAELQFGPRRPAPSHDAGVRSRRRARAAARARTLRGAARRGEFAR
ncbi:MAG: hypothetical protein QM756_23995 [Polyangiaceae bacterium]